MNVAIRSAHDADVRDIRRIHQSAIRQVCALDYPARVIAAWLAGNRDDRYRRAIRKHSFWMLECGNETTGFGCINLADGILESLFLTPAWRGRGLAAKLLMHLEGLAHAEELPMLRLNSSLSAASFYKKHGYQLSPEDGSIMLQAGIQLEGLSMIKYLDRTPRTSTP